MAVVRAGSGNGFTAIEGWDAATGFGTPDFEKLSQLVMATAPVMPEQSIVV